MSNLDELARAHLAEIAEINSSDEASSDEETNIPRYMPGTKTAVELFANANENRVRSKKALKNHKVQVRSPGSQINLERWGNVFGAYLRSQSIPDEAAPTGETLYRFVETIAHTIKGKQLDKDVPGVSTMMNGLRCIQVQMVEKFDAWTISNHWARRIDSLLNGLVKDGVLTRGMWRPAERVGFKTVLVLCRAWMQEALTEGCLSWDVIIARQLSVVLMAACGARSGDIALSQHHKGLQFLAFKDIEVRFVGGISIENIIMNVRLRFEKGHKDELNVDRMVRIDPLTKRDHNSVCAVKLILIHALRTGAVEARNLEQLISDTVARNDRVVQWTHPDLAVIRAISRMGTHVQTQEAGKARQIRETVQMMALKAGIQTDLVAHDIRRGSARDVSHLKPGAIRGTKTAAVAESVGHAQNSLSSGITGKYAGDADTSIWSLRAESEWVDSRAPRVAVRPFMGKRRRTEELDDFAEEHGLDPENRSLIHYRMFKKSKEDWRAASWNEPADEPAAQTQPLQEQNAGRINTRTANSSKKLRSKATKTVSKPAPDQALLPKSKGALGGPESSKTLIIESGTSSKDGFEGLIDPQLLGCADGVFMESDTGGDDDGLIDLDAADPSPRMESMIDALLNTISSSLKETSALANADEEKDKERNEEQAQTDLLEVLEQGLDTPPPENSEPMLMDSAAFVDYFSRINIFKNKSASLITLEDLEMNMDKYIASGNSRDAPTRFLWHCPGQGCTYSSHNLVPFQNHTSICLHIETNANRGVLRCSADPDCEYSTISRELLERHEANHTFARRQCDLGCVDGVWFETKESWEIHVHRQHSAEQWNVDQACTFPGCKRLGGFESYTDYRRHLRQAHRLKGTALEPYLQGGAGRKEMWGSRVCPVKDCQARGKDGSPTQFLTRKKLHQHLTGSGLRLSIGHRASAEEADELIDQMLIQDRKFRH